MRTFILLTFFGLLHADIVVKQLEIKEGGARYTQTATIDFDRNIQVLEVPAHNNLVHSKTIFDFNQRVMFESHPEKKVCYMKDIPEEVVSIERFASFLDKRQGPVTASKEHTTRRAYKTTSKLARHQLSIMPQEVITECGESTVFEVKSIPAEELEISYQRAPQSLAEVYGNGCHMADSCLWQTCQVGSSESCWWTVNCDINDHDCDETLDHSSVLHDCAGSAHDDCQIYCKPCYNLQCPGCEGGWEDCRPDFESHQVGTCPPDPELGKNCGMVYCPMHSGMPGGEWDCPGSEDGAPKIEEGQTCILWCNGHDFGGTITCEDDANWDESGIIGCKD